MAKEMSKLPKMPKGKAKGKVGVVEVDKALPGATKAKAHDRKAKPSEESLIDKGRRLAASYLIQRDGMDEEMAKMVVEAMEPEDINALINEANTAVIEGHPAAAAEAAVAQTTIKGGKLVDPDEDLPAPDFATIPDLANDPEFAPLVFTTATLAKVKNEAEKEYKANKQLLIAVMRAAKALRVNCGGIKLAVYTGHARFVDPIKLLEKGVSIDIINQCYSDTPYDDVRITVPKGLL